MKRVGLIGYGFIGKAIYQRILENSDHMETAFVYTRDIKSLEGVDEVIESLLQVKPLLFRSKYCDVRF